MFSHRHGMLNTFTLSSRMDIRVIFFDAAGTLFRVNGSVGETYARLAREYGKIVSVQDLEAGFRRCFATAPPMAFPGAGAAQIPRLEKAWWHDLVQQVFAPLGPFPGFEAYFTALYDFFAEPQAWQLYPEARQTLTALHARGYRLGVISNFDARLFGVLDGLDIGHFFDPIVASTYAGAAKPETAIFQKALAGCGIQPQEALHIGDSYELDIVGAQQAGLTPVLIERSGRQQHTEDCHVVHRLGELLTALESP